MRLPTRSACLLPISPGPGPFRLPVHPPNSCALDPEKGPEGKKGTVKAGRQPPPQSPWLSGLVTSLAPTPSPEPRPGPCSDSRERPRDIATGDSWSSKIAGGTQPSTLGCVGLSGKNKSNVEKAKAIFCPVRLLSPSALYLYADKSRPSSVRCLHSAASEKTHQVLGGAVYRAPSSRYVDVLFFQTFSWASLNIRVAR